jgi:ketosteroid isomerase-like protein
MMLRSCRLARTREGGAQARRPPSGRDPSGRDPSGPSRSRLTRLRPLPLLLLLAGALSLSGVRPAPLVAQADDAEVLGAVEALFDAMRARDGARALSAFLPDARIVVAELLPTGASRVQGQTAQSFAAAVGQGGDPWDEPIFNPEVRVDGGLAQVWTFYRFYAGTRFSHCGTNSIQLAKTADGWKISAITYSQRTTECDPPTDS